MIDVSSDIIEFIKDYKDLIKNQDWQALFKAWYDDNVYPDQATDTVEFECFYQLLIDSRYLNDISDTYDIRYQIMAEKLEDCWNTLEHNYVNLGKQYLPIYEIIKRLVSRLGFTEEELYKILEKELNIPYDTSKGMIIIE